MTKSRITAYVYLLLVALIWGVAGPVIKFTLADLSPVVFLTYRFFLTSLVLAPVFLISKPRLPDTWREWGLVILVGLLGSSVNLWLLFAGYARTTALDGTLLSATAPILVVVAGVMFLKEELTRREQLGLAVVLAGVVVTIFQPLVEAGGVALSSIGGNLLVMGANLAWAAYVVLSKVSLKHKYLPLTLITISFGVGFMSMLPVAVLQTGSVGGLITQIKTVPVAAHAGVWYMALVSGALAYVLFQEGQKRIEVSEATLFSYLSPIFAAPLAVWWLSETITLPYLLGAGIIAAGVGIAGARGRRNHEARHTSQVVSRS